MTVPEQDEVAVLRIDEIFLKGRNRRRFHMAFVRNARRLVRGLSDVHVHRRHLSAEVRYPAAQRRTVIARFSRLFGMSSMTIGVRCARDIDALSAAAIDVARTLPAGTSFKINPKRSDKSYPIRSLELARRIGSAVQTSTGLPVDVRAPQQQIRVEITLEGAYVFSAAIKGPGGLPIGASGKVAVLLSGGIDSPVAAWSVMRRGCVAQAIYFHSFPYIGDKTKEKVLDIARVLARWQGKLIVSIVHFTDVQKALRDAGKANLAILLYRRMMMRAATIIATRGYCSGLVTGDNLSQVSSQTLANLGVVNEAAGLPVLRPLVALDKAEIMARARQIGTYDLSIQPYDDCCSLFVPKHPATNARVAYLHEAEARLDIDALALDLADNAERIAV